MGKEAETILNLMEVTDAEKGDYSNVLEQFNEFFKVQKIVISERDRFNHHKQQEGEMTEQLS